MSYPVFKDFDKSTSDILSEDFDTKYTLKIKSAGPSGIAITTNTTYENSKNPASLSSKVSAKYAHASGFTLEKFEVGSTGSVTAETSLAGAADGLKLEFKGNDSDKGDVSFTYTTPKATFTALVDVLKLKKAEASVSSGHGAFTGGASASIGTSPYALSTTTLAVGYSVPKVFNASIKADKNFEKNFSLYKGLFSYTATKDITLAGEVSYPTNKPAAFALAGVYKCNPKTIIKLKAISSGVINASAKHEIDAAKKCSAVATAQFETGLTNPKFGLNITLG